MTLLSVLFFVAYFALLGYAFHTEDSGLTISVFILAVGMLGLGCCVASFYFSVRSGALFRCFGETVLFLMLLYFQVCLLAPLLPEWTR